ncbi:hypothetical protein DFJ77DRAFT_108277 [Powellomyces hirtus]|nr:hypothetical protein DFJ77DRAFT_108277 [Powellomyces hirtus]
MSVFVCLTERNARCQNQRIAVCVLNLAALSCLCFAKEEAMDGCKWGERDFPFSWLLLQVGSFLVWDEVGSSLFKSLNPSVSLSLLSSLSRVQRWRQTDRQNLWVTRRDFLFLSPSLSRAIQFTSASRFAPPFTLNSDRFFSCQKSTIKAPSSQTSPLPPFPSHPSPLLPSALSLSLSLSSLQQITPFAAPAPPASSRPVPVSVSVS